MKMFFKSRAKARTLATRSGKKVADQGASSQTGKRWAIEVKTTQLIKQGSK